MPRPLASHPDFPPGASIRVKPMGHAANPNRLRLVGRVGTVVRSCRSVVYVEFPCEQFLEHFQPHHLERVTDPPGMTDAAGSPAGKLRVKGRGKGK
jgi:hypothetical protein